VIRQLNQKSSTKIFHYNGLAIELHSEIYEPAEDTFQLLEVLEVNECDRVLEIGTGCGIITLECARRGAKVVCTDINPRAVEFTQSNYSKNLSLLKGNVEVRCGNLFSVVKPDERFDVVIFNPPYLPTRAKDRIGGSGWFDVATDGGATGLVVTKRFIEDLHKHLNKNGRAYFVFSSLSDRKKLNTYLSNAKLKSEILLSRRFNDEKIDIYRVYF
jgi:release factor glutamine methyltransferase